MTRNTRVQEKAHALEQSAEEADSDDGIFLTIYLTFLMCSALLATNNPLLFMSQTSNGLLSHMRVGECIILFLR